MRRGYAAGRMVSPSIVPKGSFNPAQPSIEALLAALEAQGCGNCWSCDPAYQFMLVCSECGNKRCPHANDHRNLCTGSNDPGQAGSAYEHGSGAATARRWAAFFEKEEK